MIMIIFTSFNPFYGNQEKIVAAYIDKVISWPNIPAHNIDSFDEFSIILRTCLNATLSKTSVVNELEHPKTLLKILEKFPTQIKDRWRRKVDRISEKQQRSIKFEDLVE